jgi:hypothetical protein
MTRIHASLAVLTLFLLAAVGGLGLALRGTNIRDPFDSTAQTWATVHRLAGITVGLLVVLVHSIAATYFIGTGRWCREVAEAYGLDRSLVIQSSRLKRSAFPFAAGGMLAAVGLVASGGAADPGAALQVRPPAGLGWTDVHFATALVVIAFTAWALFAQRQAIAANQAVIGRIAGEVARIRAERGLDRL